VRTLPGVDHRLSELVGGVARLRVLVLLASVLGLEAADNATVGAVAAPLEQALRIGNVQLGLLVTVSTAVGALATLPFGVLVDRVPRIPLLSGAIVVWSAAMVVSGLAVSYPMLLITRLGLGAVVAMAGPSVASLTGDLFPPGERGRIYGYILSGELIGTGAGVLLSGVVAGVLSWRASFIALAVPGVILAFAVHHLLPEPDRGGSSRLFPASTGKAVGGPDGRVEPTDHRAGRTDDDLASQLRSRHVAAHPAAVLTTDPSRMPLVRAVRYVLAVRTNIALVVASSLGYFFYSGLRTFAVEFLRSRFGLGQSTASLLLVVIAVASVLGVLMSGRLADRLVRHGRVAARPVIAGGAFLLAAALFVPGLLATSVVAAMTLIFLASLAYGATNPPLDAARLDIMHHRLWGRAEAIRTMLRTLLEAAAPLVVGVISVSFGGTNAGLGATSGSTAAAAGGAKGLDATFLIMLVPLAIAGLTLVSAARRTYPRDVATAIESEGNTDVRSPRWDQTSVSGRRSTPPTGSGRGRPRPPASSPLRQRPR
jgi:MFS family permease